ncbi:hypothetical protein AB0881_35930, partial [Spirillospora sp. NPDC029432]
PTAEMGRRYGAFGPEVKVPESAPLLDRLLGMDGRAGRLPGHRAPLKDAGPVRAGNGDLRRCAKLGP